MGARSPGSRQREVRTICAVRTAATGSGR